MFKELEKFLLEGVNKFLYSFNTVIASLILILGNRRPHFGKLLLEEDTHKLELRSKINEAERTGNEKTNKIIDLKGKKHLTIFVTKVTVRSCFVQTMIRNITK